MYDCHGDDGVRARLLEAERVIGIADALRAHTPRLASADTIAERVLMGTEAANLTSALLRELERARPLVLGWRTSPRRRISRELWDASGALERAIWGAEEALSAVSASAPWLSFLLGGSPAKSE